MKQMIKKQSKKEQNEHTPCTKLTFHLQRTNHAYHGKVRDMYTIEDGNIVAVVSDRISAFDVVLPKGIPYKGQVLNGIASHFLDAVSDIVPTWKKDTPHPQVTIGYACEPSGLRWSSAAISRGMLGALTNLVLDPSVANPCPKA